MIKTKTKQLGVKVKTLLEEQLLLRWYLHELEYRQLSLQEALELETPRPIYTWV